MKRLRRIAGALLLVLIALALLLWLEPPALLRVGANYAAKIVCSNVFLAGRNPTEVLRVDVQSPGIALLKFMQVSVQRERGVVRAGFLGVIGDGLAVYRPGRGCTVVPDGKLQSVAALTAPMAYSPPPSFGAVVSALWPESDRVETDSRIDQLLTDPALAGPGVRAMVVVDHGRIVGERYATGFNPRTPLLGWSMTKTVLAGAIGLLIKDGKLSLDQAGFWSGHDGRERIRLKDLLAMSSGLAWNEAYGVVSDVTAMLYLQPDMAQYARSKPLGAQPGAVWVYSSGTALILSRIAEDALGPPPDLASFINLRLFGPVGMSTAIIEPDEHGTLVGSSYMYATARDWARYGQFLLQDGVWQGRTLLPAGYVEMMATPVAASRGQYGAGLTWRWGSDAATPGVDPDAAFGIPPDVFYMSGHDGQSVAIIKSRQLVIVRLGLTPYTAGYSPQPLVKAVLEATQAAIR
ncbi:MAG TPA: serine hydrolase [Steroidobacteraceae bacterium]|jgi:CubicO group peptidase (beta-lactamase class C family)|nr:serine hydrolase [Steroidobacteraceae bacterium]